MTETQGQFEEDRYEEMGRDDGQKNYGDGEKEEEDHGGEKEEGNTVQYNDEEASVPNEVEVAGNDEKDGQKDETW